MTERPYIIINGNPLEGYKYFGPFKDFEGADDFATKFLTMSDCWITEVKPGCTNHLEGHRCDHCPDLTLIPQDDLQGIKATLINLDDRLISAKPLSDEERANMSKDIEDRMADLEPYIKLID